MKKEDEKPAGVAMPPAGAVEQPDTRAADLAAAEQRGVQREAERRASIEAVFAYQNWARDFGDTLKTCLSDPACDAARAQAMLLKRLGEASGDVVGGELDMGHRISAGTDERQKTVDGAVSALLKRSGGISARDVKLETGNEFRGLSLTEVARKCLERAGHNTRGLTNMEIVGRAFTQSTADFPVILENTMHKSMNTAFEAIETTWRRWCKVGSTTDFRTWNRINRGFLGSLDDVSELGEFLSKSIPDGVKESIQVGTKGNIINISRQAVVNDDLGYFADMAAMLGSASALTVETLAWSVLNSNPTMNEDSTTLFHANHGNLAGSGAVPSVETLDAARVAMGLQKDHTGNQYIMVSPYVALVPLAQGGNTRVINDAQYDPDTANKLQRPNKVNGMLSDIISSPYLSVVNGSTATAWYVLANPMMHPVVEVAFLNGQESPYLETVSGFTVDGFQVKARLDVGAAAVGWRGAYKNPGA